MTLEKTISALKQMKISCSATQLEELEFAISVLEKLLKDGVKDPLSVDYTKL